MTTITKVSRTKGSLLPTKVSSVVPGKELKSSEKKGHSQHLSEAVINENQNGFLVEVIWWSFDDAGEDYYVFDNLRAAKICYNYFLKPYSEKILESEPNKIVIVKRGDIKKHIPGIAYKGFFVQSYFGGDLLKPYFDSTAAPELMTELKSFINQDTDIRDILGTKFEICLMKMGENTGGLSVYFEGESPVLTDNIVYTTIHRCWETGLVYRQLTSRLAENVFKAIKPFLQYHAEEIEEEGDWKGWYITDFNSCKSKLASFNLTLNEN
jgi:hypothetical protein